MTTEAPEPDAAISREAHDRVKGENAALQTKVDELTKTVTDLGVKEIVRAHFTTKGLDGEGAEWAATFALPSIPKDTEADQLGTYLDEHFDRLYPAVTGAVETPGETPDATPQPAIPTPDAVEPPGFARPSPAGDGQPPGETLVTVDDAEFKNLLASGDEAGLQQLVKSDRFRWRTQALEQPGQ